MDIFYSQLCMVRWVYTVKTNVPFIMLGIDVAYLFVTAYSCFVGHNTVASLPYAIINCHAQGHTFESYSLLFSEVEMKNVQQLKYLLTTVLYNGHKSKNRADKYTHNVHLFSGAN